MKAAANHNENQWDLLIAEAVLPEYSPAGGELGQLIWDLKMPDEDSILGTVKLELTCDTNVYWGDLTYIGLPPANRNPIPH